MELKNYRHELFCRKYIELGIGIDAYKAAGYACKNDQAAKAAASRLLTNVNVQKRIEELKSKLWNKLDKKADVILQENYNHAMADIGDLFDSKRTKEGTSITLKDIKALSPETRRLIASLEIKADGTIKLKIVDKQKALEMMMRNQALFTDRKRIEGDINLHHDDLENMSDEELLAENDKLKRQLEITE